MEDSPADLMVSCQVCLCRYNSEDQRPLLLPACGHTFCAFCVQLLLQQGKTSCPKCRKDKAVLPVSSLPVNYSLLEITQRKYSGAAAEERPSSPTEETAVRNSRPPDVPQEHSDFLRWSRLGGLHSRRLHKKVKPNPLQPVNVRGSPMFTQASGFGLTTAGPSTSAYTALPTPARTMQAHKPNPTQGGPEKELQDELDFHMAVHLTFCKDQNHDLDQHTSCPVWRKQVEDDDDLKTILTILQQI